MISSLRKKELPCALKTVRVVASSELQQDG
jgi:hypothetical protein